MFSAFYWITPLIHPSKEYMQSSRSLGTDHFNHRGVSGVIISLSSSFSNIVAVNNLRETKTHIQPRKKDPPMGWFFLRGAGYSKSSD